MPRFLRPLPCVAIAALAIGLLAFHVRAQLDPVARSAVIKVVPPEYPFEARRSRITDHGVLVGEVDFKTGNVTLVKMEKSTGNKLLDQAALNAFRQWQFKPRVIRTFRIPINFSLP